MIRSGDSVPLKWRRLPWPCWLYSEGSSWIHKRLGLGSIHAWAVLLCAHYPRSLCRHEILVGMWPFHFLAHLHALVLVQLLARRRPKPRRTWLDVWSVESVVDEA